MDIELLNEALSMLESESNGNTINPFTDKATNSFAQGFIDAQTDNKLSDYFKRWKNKCSHIEYMTPDEFFNTLLLNSYVLGWDKKFSKEELLDYADDEYTKQYAEKMKNGEKFPMPHIDLSSPMGGEEGMHRMLAAKKAFGDDKSYPVLIIQDYRDNEEENNREDNNVIEKEDEIELKNIPDFEITDDDLKDLTIEDLEDML